MPFLSIVMDCLRSTDWWYVGRYILPKAMVCKHHPNIKLDKKKHLGGNGLGRIAVDAFQVLDLQRLEL